MFCVYVLRSEQDGEFYIGQTVDLTRRLAEHNAGHVRSTRRRRPLTLVGHKTFGSREEARYFEYGVKHHSDKKRAFIAKLLNEPRC
jgi:predicted GIY-YIG superfamily endonuclease